MNNRNLQYVLALWEEGTISKAAEKLFISPSALSQSISKIEEHIGNELFERKDGRFVPTEAGRIYIRSAQQIIKLEEKTRAKILNTTVSSELLRIYVNYDQYPYFVQNIMPSIQSRMPKLKINVRPTLSETAEKYLLNNIADIAIYDHISMSNSLLTQIPMGRDYLVGYVSTKNIQADLPDRVKSAEDILSYTKSLPLILMKSETIGRQLQNSILQTYHLDTKNILYETDNYLAAKRLVELGNGITFLPSSLAVPAANCRVFSVNKIEYFHILAYRHLRVNKPEIIKVIQLIRENHES